MKLSVAFTPALLASYILFASQAAFGQTSSKSKDSALVKVGSDVITLGQLDSMQAIMQQRTDGQVNRAALLDELVKMTLLAQEAERQKLDQRPEVKTALDQQRVAILSTAMYSHMVETTKLTDNELNEIEKIIPAEEYRVNYMVVESEATAKALIEKIQNGADFASLAKTHSIDASRDSGGDVGWVNALNANEELIAVVDILEQGKVNEKPIRTDIGWQILRLQSKRLIDLTDVEKLRQNMIMQYTAEKVVKKIAELKSKAQLVYY